MKADVDQLSFNSIVVRLKVKADVDQLKKEKGFNSIVVRLKVLCQALQIINHNGFNSIVVRLKGNNPMLLALSSRLFQFHSGSIKSQKSQR